MIYTIEIDGVGVEVSQLNIILTIDHTLDYGNFIVRNDVAEAFSVGTQVDIDVSDDDTTRSFHFIIQSDTVDKIRNGHFIHTIDVIELTKILEWQTESVRTFTQPLTDTQITMFDVVRRLQYSVPLVNTSELETSRIFVIDAQTTLKLQEIEAPEMVFANKNLKEILFEVFDFIGAIPRLTKVSNNIVLTADFYNKRNNLVTDNEFNRMEIFNLDGFSTALDADIKNLYDSYTDVVEPSLTGFKKVSTSDGDFREETAFLNTDYPIVEVVELKVKTDIFNRLGAVLDTNVVLDLTDYILEIEEWDFLENINILSDSKTSFRDNTLFFKRFQQGIDGLFDSVGAYRGVAFIGGIPRIILTMRRAAIAQDIDMGTFDQNMTKRFGDYFQLEFQIKYRAQVDSRTEVKRLDTRRIKFESQSYTGQADNVVRADRVLDRLFKLQQLLGNAENITGERTKTLANLKELADFNSSDYIITTIELQFQKTYILAKYMWSQNYQKISEFIGLNAGIRLFDVPNDTYQRNVYIEDFIEIATTSSANTSKVTIQGVNTFMNTIRPSARAAFNKPIKLLSFDNEQNPSINPSTETIIKSVSAYAGGNSINFYMEFTNSKVAGGQVRFFEQTDVQFDLTPLVDDPELTSIEEIQRGLQTGIGVVKNWFGSAVEFAETTLKLTLRKPRVNSIYYTDQNGEVLDFSFQMLHDATIASAQDLPVIPKSAIGATQAKMNSGLIRLHKDIREELAITYAMHVMPAPTLEKTIIVGKLFIERNNLIQFVDEASGQFEVFTSTTPYEINENRFSRTTDTPSAITYSINSNVLALSTNTSAQVWGIRKASTRELVLAVNQLGTTISTLHFNFKNKQSNVTYPSQTVTAFVRLERPSAFGASATTTTSITLTWTDPNATTVNYHIEQSENNRDWTRQTVTDTTATFSGLDNGTVYYYRVRSLSVDNFSEWSHTRVTAGVLAPNAPNLATPLLLGARRIRVFWEDNQSDILGYVVEASLASNFATLIPDGIRSGTQAEFFTTYDNVNSSIDFDETYFFRVRGFKLQGIFSPYSNVVQIDVPAQQRTSAPTIINPTITSTTVTFFLLNTFNTPVTMSAVLGTTAPGTVSGSVGVVQPNELTSVTLSYTTETHIYAVATSTNTAFFSSSVVVDRQFQADLPPGTPSITSIVTNVGNTVVNWSYTGPFIDGFFINRSPTLQGDAGTDVLVGYISPTIFRFTDFNVGSQITYTYTVVARNRVGTASSATSTITTTTMTPAPPSNLTVSAFAFASPEGEALVQINWQSNSASFEDGFQLQRSGGSAGPFVTVGGTVRSVTSTTDVVQLTPGVTSTFFYQVLAFSNEYGNSAPSAVASTTLTG